MNSESTVVRLKRSVRYIPATVIVLLCILSLFTSSVFAGNSKEYNVIINDNGKEITITTEETEPLEILNEANLTIGSSDRLSIAGFNAGEGGTIVIDRLNTINIKIGDEIKNFDVYADTVGEAFEELGISTEKCITDYDAAAPVENGMVITIINIKTITINADGSSVTKTVFDGTVEDALALEGITLGSDDYTEPALDTEIEDGMEISVFRVTFETVEETETINYSTETKTDDSLEIGTSEIEVQGENGEKNVTYKITYVNGEEASRETVSETVTKEAVTEVKVVGTKAADVTPNGVTSYGSYTLGQSISGKYTHYCMCAKCCGKSNGITASGRRVYTGMPDPYYIACNWLPMGSVISVNGVNYTVVDRGGGGLSSSGRIDIFTPGGHQAALNAGTGKCTITFVRFGW